MEKPTCPYCDKVFRSANSLDTHLKGPEGKPEKAWHKREQAKTNAEAVLAKPVKDKALGNTQQAIKESMIAEEERREAAKLLRKERPYADLPVIGWRALFTIDLEGKTEAEIRAAAIALLKEIRPKAKVDFVQIQPLV